MLLVRPKIRKSEHRSPVDRCIPSSNPGIARSLSVRGKNAPDESLAFCRKTLARIRKKSIGRSINESILETNDPISVRESSAVTPRTIFRALLRCSSARAGWLTGRQASFSFVPESEKRPFRQRHDHPEAVATPPNAMPWRRSIRSISTANRPPRRPDHRPYRPSASLVAASAPGYDWRCWRGGALVFRRGHHNNTVTATRCADDPRRPGTTAMEETIIRRTVATIIEGAGHRRCRGSVPEFWGVTGR